MKKILAFLFLCVFFGSFVYGLAFWSSTESQNVGASLLYDNFGDDSLNTTLWTLAETETGASTVTTTETNQKIEMTVANGDDGTNYGTITSDENYVSYLKWDVDKISAGTTHRIRVKVGGTLITDKEYNTPTYDDYATGTWELNSTGTNHSLHKNGVYLRSFVGLSGVVEFYLREDSNTQTSEHDFDDVYLNKESLMILKNAPANLTNTTATYMFLNSTVYPQNSSLVLNNITVNNMTFHTWYINGTKFNTTTLNVASKTATTKTTNHTTLGKGTYLWDVSTWQTLNNGTALSIFDTEGNRTFSIMGFAENSFTFNTPVLEQTSQDFSVNLTLVDGLSISSATFNYGSRTASPTITTTGGVTTLSVNNFNVPAVTSETIYTFNYSLTYDDGITQTTSNRNQTVTNFGIDNCTSSVNVLFNFTMVDEKTQAQLVGNPDNTSIKIDLTLTDVSNSSLTHSFSQFFNETNPAAVCLNGTMGAENFYVDAIVEYKAKGKFQEYYHIQKYNLSNSTANQKITLYNLNSSEGQEFKITYKDSNFNTVPGAIIQVQRKYIEDGVFKTVEIPKIGGQGYTMTHLVVNDIIYNLIVLKDGVVLGTFNNVVAACQNPLLQECAININSFSSTVQPEDYTTSGDFTSTLSWNRSSRTATATFVVVSGASQLTQLNTTLMDNHGNTTLCSQSVTASGGTLTCTIASTASNGTAYIHLTSGGDLKRSAWVSLAQDADSIYGNSLVYIAISIMLLIIGMSITDNPMILGVMLIFGTVLLVVLNIVNSAGWLGGGAMILWLVVAIVIILIKGANRQ